MHFASRRRISSATSKGLEWKPVLSLYVEFGIASRSAKFAAHDIESYIEQLSPQN